MDKLTRESQDHKGIFEALTFFRKSLSVTSDEKREDYVKDLSKFFQENIDAHFEFEEKEIFPLVLAVSSSEEKHFIRELQQEHIRILDKLDQFNELIVKSGFHPEEKQKNELLELSNEIIKMVLDHARKEDLKLFPILENIGIDLK